MPCVKSRRERGGRGGRESALLKDFTFMNYAGENGLGEGGKYDFPAEFVECKNVFEHQLSCSCSRSRSGVGCARDNIDKVVSAVSVFAHPSSPLLVACARALIVLFIYCNENEKQFSIFYISFYSSAFVVVVVSFFK